MQHTLTVHIHIHTRAAFSQSKDYTFFSWSCCSSWPKSSGYIKQLPLLPCRWRSLCKEFLSLEKLWLFIEETMGLSLVVRGVQMLPQENIFENELWEFWATAAEVQIEMNEECYQHICVKTLSLQLWGFLCFYLNKKITRSSESEVILWTSFWRSLLCLHPNAMQI